MTTWNPHVVITAIARSGDDQQPGLAIRIVAPARAGVSSSPFRTETARPVQTPLPPMLAAMVRRYRPARCAPGAGWYRTRKVIRVDRRLAGVQMTSDTR